VGASFDTQEENRGFKDLQGLPFRLLCDVDHAVGKIYETERAPEEHYTEWAKRRTYLIDPEGMIRKAYRVTDIPAHPDEVLADLAALTDS
jgi:thioredoxin-dependent peroxiredoxin